MNRRAVQVIYSVGICAHLYDLLLHGQPHDHGTLWDLTMHGGWLVILFTALIDTKEGRS